MVAFGREGLWRMSNYEFSADEHVVMESLKEETCSYQPKNNGYMMIGLSIRLVKLNYLE